jgi:hypothetical protein
MYAALSVGLAVQSPVRLVVLDEFDIDAGNFTKLINRFGRLIADKKIDQVVLAHTSPAIGVEMPKGVELLQVEVKRS